MIYYEIICSVGVIGVCSGEANRLLDAAQWDRVLQFGEISQEEFQSYENKPWYLPVSKLRWTPSIKLVLERKEDLDFLREEHTVIPPCRHRNRIYVSSEQFYLVYKCNECGTTVRIPD